MQNDYPAYHQQLKRLLGQLSREVSGPMSGFQSLHQEAMSDEGALSRKTKELMALSIGIVTGCEGCLAFHIDGALNAGATRNEVAETIGVAVMMGGGPATMYGAEALRALDQFEEAR